MDWRQRFGRATSPRRTRLRRRFRPAWFGSTASMNSTMRPRLEDTSSPAGAEIFPATRSRTTCNSRRFGRSCPMSKPKRTSRPGARALPRAQSSRSVSAARDDLASLKSWFEEKHLEKAKVGAVDIDGVWRGKYLSAEKVFSPAGSGLGFCDLVFRLGLRAQVYDNAAVTGC